MKTTTPDYVSADHPAFPCAEDHKVAADFPWTQGLNKRELFAGMAIMGLIATSRDFTADAEASSPISTWKDYAQASVQAADALLKELSK